MPIDYWQTGYNGYWQGYWGNSLVGISQLDLQFNEEARAAFVAGWNTAEGERILAEREQEIKNYEQRNQR